MSGIREEERTKRRKAEIDAQKEVIIASIASSAKEAYHSRKSNEAIAEMKKAELSAIEDEKNRAIISRSNESIEIVAQTMLDSTSIDVTLRAMKELGIIISEAIAQYEDNTTVRNAIVKYAISIYKNGIESLVEQGATKDTIKLHKKKVKQWKWDIADKGLIIGLSIGFVSLLIPFIMMAVLD